MTSFAIGDVQGCFHSFQALLHKIEFNSDRDHLIFAGDIINGGAHSLEMAKWIIDHSGGVSAVLGNHDIHFLGVCEGVQSLGGRDTLKALLDSTVAEDFREWLLKQCFFKKWESWSLSHAGILPEWTLAEAETQSDRLMETLRGNQRSTFLESYRKPFPLLLKDVQSNEEHQRFTLSAFTRMRACEPDGSLNFSFNGLLKDLPDSLVPWFRARENTSETPIVFGHWAALGNHTENHCYGIDSGCVWGNGLTAFNLETKERITVPTKKADIVSVSS